MVGGSRGKNTRSPHLATLPTLLLVTELWFRASDRLLGSFKANIRYREE